VDAAGLLPHHDGSPLHVSSDDPALGDVVEVRVRVPAGYGPLRRVLVRSHPDEEPAWAEATRDGIVDGWEWWTAGIRAANPRTGYRFHLQHEDGRVEVLSQAGLTDIDALDAHDFALLAGNPPPPWLDEAVMYQIFPDRFARSAAADERPVPDWAIPAAWDEPVDPLPPGRSAQLYGGDLDGALERLDHLVDLGVTVLYHTPIFPAESNHRYDATSFDRVDPLLGGDDAYLRLIEAAHARGIRVIGDLTCNHSGSGHEWFRAAYGDPAAPEGEFYCFTDDAHTAYESWLGATSLPKFQWRSGELRRRFIEGDDSVVARWLRPPYAIDGWRIDVANMTGRRGADDLNAEVRRTLRQTMIDVAPDTLLLAEYTADPARDLQGDAWHGAMTYPAFTRGVWAWLGEPRRIRHHGFDGQETDEPWFFGVPTGMPRYTARQFAAQFRRFTSQIPWRVQRATMSALDTHDTARFATYAPAEAVAVALGLSVTLPGIPVVYAGDEFALDGVDGEMSRTPVPWHRVGEPAVSERIDLYRRLLALRAAHPVLATGGLRWLHADDGGLAFVRESAEECVLVVAARDGLDVRMPAAAVTGPAAARRLHGDATLEALPDGGAHVRATGTGFSAWSLPGVAAPQRPRAASAA
jgi:alpha-glucosidase